MRQEVVRKGANKTKKTGANDDDGPDEDDDDDDDDDESDEIAEDDTLSTDDVRLYATTLNKLADDGFSCVVDESMRRKLCAATELRDLLQLAMPIATVAEGSDASDATPSAHVRCAVQRCATIEQAAQQLDAVLRVAQQRHVPMTQLAWTHASAWAHSSMHALLNET